MIETFDQLRPLIVDVLGVYTPEQILPESNFAKDLGADELDMFELKMEIEDNFSIEIPDPEVLKIETVADLVALVDRLNQADRGGSTYPEKQG